MQEVEVKNFINEYCDAFRPGNNDEIAMYFHYPVAMLVNGMNLSINDTDELEAMLGGMLHELESKGFSYSKPQEVHVHSLSDEIVIVSARYHRFKSDDTILEEISATYTLCKNTDSTWKIVTIIGHDVDSLIRK